MIRRSIWFTILGFVFVTFDNGLCAKQPPSPRLHKVIVKGKLRLVAADSDPKFPSEVSIKVNGTDRVIKSNGIPNHKTGQFPNRGNPNPISVQRHEYRVPAHPEVADQTTPMQGEFGVAINGVPFDPGAAEFYDGEPGWQYEPLSGAIALGIDMSHAHVQPNGKYHYHGLPSGLLDSVKLDAEKHSPLIGWAADGFPIYALYGYRDAKDSTSKVNKLTSSYQLKRGERPGGNAPSGNYDGTFVLDYEYVEGSGDLDQCNGRFTVTPEFPDGTYAYFLSDEWPVIPRFYRGTPSSDFRHGPAGPGGPGGQGPGRNGPAGGFPGGPPPGMMRPGLVLPDFLRQSLSLSEEQIEQLDALQQEVDERLKSILSKEQMRQLENGPPRGGRPPRGR